MKKKLILIIIAVVGTVILFTGSFFAFRIYNTYKAVKKGMDLMSNKEYSKAIASFDLALDETPSNIEASEYKEMIENYLEAKKLFDEDNFEESNTKIKEISEKYNNYIGLKEDILNLIGQIDDAIKKDAEITNTINKIRELVSGKNYDEAKIMLSNIENENFSAVQKQQIEDLKSLINSELAKIDAEKNAQIAEAQKQAEIAKNKTITAKKAEALVKNYLMSRGEFVPPIIKVDSEDDSQYCVHCYEQFTDHTATSGWYYVNKKTGNITSMF